MEISSRQESYSMKSQKDSKGEEGHEQTYFVPPLPDSPNKITKVSGTEDESISDITPREEDEQEEGTNMKRKRKEPEGHNSEKSLGEAWLESK